MRKYWTDRRQSIPRPLSKEEASAISAWVVYLTESIDEGVTLTLEQPAGLDQHNGILHDLTEERLRRAPTAFGKFVGHLLAGTNQLQEAVVDLPRVV